MLFAALSTIFTAFGVVASKIALSKKKLPVSVFLPVIFAILALSTLVVFLFIRQIDFGQILQSNVLFLFSLMILFAFVWNIIESTALSKEPIYEFELIIMMAPLVTILVASIILPEERNIAVFGASLVAALALFWAHLDHNHLRFDRYSETLLVALFLIAFESILIKKLLASYHPVTLYLFRTTILTVAFFLWYRPKLAAVPKGAWAPVVLSGILGAASMIFRFYGYQLIGIVFTTLILIFGPILVYFASVLYFREHLKPKTIPAAIVILGAIIYASLFA